MKLPYRMYDVFADSPFAGTQIAVIITEEEVEEALKIKIVSEFSHSDTVFVNKSNSTAPFSVYNKDGKTTFGAHTTLAAAQTAHDLGMTHSESDYFAFDLVDDGLLVNTFIDNTSPKNALVLFSRQFDFTTDRYVPELSTIAQALGTDVKHLAYSRYKPRMVRVDSPVLIVPMTKPEHIIDARLDPKQWLSLMSEIYAQSILLIAPGSITGQADFHGRLLLADSKPKEYPPIGSVMPEFIAYLCSCEDTSRGTHTVTIDRGSYDTRQSLIHAEFDYRKGHQAKCRIGGKVILMSQGEFVFQGD